MINIPKSWSDVKVGTWQELNLIESDNDITKKIQQVSILTDCDEAEIRQLPIRQWQELNQQLDLIQRPMSKIIKTKIEVDGKKYGIIPDFNFLTTGEFLDAENWKDKPIENLHLYLALIYRPIVKENGEEYQIEPHKSDGFMRRAELFRDHLTIDEIYSAVLFFSALGLNCMQVIADYLEEEPMSQQEMIVKMNQTQSVGKKNKQKTSKKNGSGMI